MEGAVVAAKVSHKGGATPNPAEEHEPLHVVKVHEGWLVKRAPKARHGSKKRWFVLYSDGLVRYFAAVSPEGEPTGEKGNFHVFKDTPIQITDGSGKKGADRVLLIASLNKNGLDDREWHLTAESASDAAKWKEQLVGVAKRLDIGSADHRAHMERQKMVENSVMKRLGNKVAGTLSSARSTMKSFGFAGSVTVSGSIMGLSVSMSLEIESEEGEGELEINPGEAGAASPDGGDDDDDDDDYEEMPKEEEADEGTYNEAYDLDKEESPAKESMFKRTIKKGMGKAMGKVKVLAFEMKKHKLTGSVGVGVDVTIFGTGITIEFEVSLSSTLTEAEYQEMLQHEQEKKQERLEKKGKKGKDAKQLSSSRRQSASVAGD